jgi:hypothetical protein
VIARRGSSSDEPEAPADLDGPNINTLPTREVRIPMHVHAPWLVFAYFGPETVLPMTSVLATIAGLFMMFGRTTWRLLFRRRWFGRKASKPVQAVRAPHFSRQEPAQASTSHR